MKIHTVFVMTSSAIAMGITGIALSFFPKELTHLIHPDSPVIYSLILQIIGALYFAFGMLNWTARENLIGGIYGRPICIANLTHFTVGGLALIKSISAGNSALFIWIALIIYTAYAVLFSLILFTHPATKES